MNKHVLTLSYRTEGGSLTIKTEEIEGDMSVNIERLGLTAGSTGNQFHIGSVAPTDIKGIAFGIKKTSGQSADKVAEATFMTNSTVSPSNTFSDLTPTQGMAWTYLDVLNTNPITSTITDVYVDVTGTANIDIAIRVLVDSTPALAG